MTANMSYAEQLRHPKWQKKRLEVLERADFKCELCRDSETTLNVHHKRYVKGRKAWEYAAGELTALCQPCHEVAHEVDEEFKTVLASLNPDGPCNTGDVMGLVAGWTRGYGDVPEATRLAQAAPVVAVAGIVARQLCESIGWTKGGLMSLMSLAQALQSEQFVQLLREAVDDATEAARKAEKPEIGSSNA